MTSFNSKGWGLTSPFLFVLSRAIQPLLWNKIAEERITMTNVVMFPQRKRLPKVIEERLHQIAKDYVETLYSAAMLMDLEEDKTTVEEIQELVVEALNQGFYDAMEDLED